MSMQFEKIVADIGKKLNVHNSCIEEINKGANNKLLKLTSTNGELFLVKIYHETANDGLQREFQAVQFLYNHGFPVPKAFYENESMQYAVYSYEEGAWKNPKDISKEDIKKIALFCTKLYKLPVSAVTTPFPPAKFACFSLQDYITNIDYRMKQFNDGLLLSTTSEEIKQFAKTHDIQKKVAAKVSKLVAGISPTELTKILPESERRLSPADFGVHNMIFKNDESIVIVDFEYFGWDDPAKLIGSFLVHDQTIGLSDELKEYFLQEYIKNTHITAEEIRHIEIVTKFLELEWVSILLGGLSPEKIKIRQFAAKNFDLHAYIADKCKKITARVERMDI